VRKICSLFCVTYRLPMQSYYTAGGLAVPRHSGGLQAGVGSGMRSGPQAQTQTPQNKSRRLYVGNIPYHAGISENGMVQLFSAMYVAGFRALLPGEPLPVTSFWLHADGKFGFMELRGDSEAVDMMQFNGLILHGRPLRVNRPSDFRPEMHAGANLPPSPINAIAVQDLCNQLSGLVAPPSHITAAAAVATSAVGSAPMGNAVNGYHSVGGGSVSSPVAPVFRSQPQNPVPLPLPQSPPVANAQESPVVSGSVQPSSTGPVVISLRHVVSSADLDGTQEEYDDLLDDIKEECSQYGAVVDICIPRSGRGKGAAFISYSTRSDALRAAENLRKRVFNGNAIEALVVEDATRASAAAATWID
jgi:splicing factor U2AF 65 kDa subunit